MTVISAAIRKLGGVGRAEHAFQPIGSTADTKTAATSTVASPRPTSSTAGIVNAAVSRRAARMAP